MKCPDYKMALAITS